MPETSSDHREGDQRIPKKGGKLEKYKWWIIGGLLLIGALVFFFVNKSKQNANQQGTQTPAGTPSGVDPSTGVPYSMEYGDYGAAGYGGFGGYGGGGGPGPPGPPGPRGPRGPRGRRNDRDWWNRQFLGAKGGGGGRGR